MKKSVIPTSEHTKMKPRFVSKLVLSLSLAAASLPVFASAACDRLVGEFAKKESGDVWMRVAKTGDKYSLSTKGAILSSDNDKPENWDDKPAMELGEIPKARLESFRELNGNKPLPPDMCGLESTSKVAILVVPVGYRYGEDADEVSKTGYLLVVFAGPYGVGTRDIYRAK